MCATLEVRVCVCVRERERERERQRQRQREGEREGGRALQLCVWMYVHECVHVYSACVCEREKSWKLYTESGADPLTAFIASFSVV